MINITITTDNAAFVDNYNLETRLILEQAWEKLLNKETDFKLRDSNGNTVGEVKVTE